MWFCLMLAILGSAVVTEVTSECPKLPHTDGITTVKVVWRYDMWYDQCRANIEGSANVTTFSKGERKALTSLDNPCLVFLCDYKTKTLRLDTRASSCMYNTTCTKDTKYRPSCSRDPYTCYTAVYAEAAKFTYSDWYQYRRAWISVFSGYTCGKRGSGPCSQDQCFNPNADPKNLTLYTGPGCVDIGGRVVNASESQAYECQRFKFCGAGTSVDLVKSGKVCDHNGRFVPAGTVTWSDACSETVCDVSSGVSKLITSFKGCLYEDKCYKEWQKVTLEDSCRRMYCRRNATTGKYYLEQQLRGQCTPKETQCVKKNGAPGCRHKGRCYAVKTVLTVDGCLQYVCYSDDPDLNSGSPSAKSPDPQWKARATGCYGPRGCMSFGQQYVDPHTNNTYRCDYHLGGFGIKKTQFHKGSIEYIPEDHNHTCGNNPDTGRKLYRGEFYFTMEGRCKRAGYYCYHYCQYFDHLTPYRHIGDKFVLSGAECTCTQDYEVNNVKIPSTGSLFNTPSLCGQQDVRGAACKDPKDDSLHQWGELWQQSRGKKICTCHPLHRVANCSDYLPDVVKVLENMQI
ncbi:hypothetical protein ACOMHN_005859 [Nucella lapillus]